jgi:hypothetical protein
VPKVASDCSTINGGYGAIAVNIKDFSNVCSIEAIAKLSASMAFRDP